MSQSIRRAPRLLFAWGLLACLALQQGCYFAKNTTPKSADVPFARVEPGIGTRELQKITGPSDDVERIYRGTGVIGAILLPILVVWDLPLFLNRTDYINIYYFQGQGHIITTRDDRVRQVIYDPEEDGYR